MKSLNIDIIFPWEIGLVFLLIGIFMIVFGVRQSKLEVDDFDKISFIKSIKKFLWSNPIITCFEVAFLQIYEFC